MNKIHIALNSFHFDEAVAFYTEILASEPDKLSASYAKFSSDIAPINLTLNKTDTPIKGSQINHLGIEVFDRNDIRDAINKFKAAKLDCVEEMDTQCCFAHQDKVWVKDPDNNAWEFFFVHEQLEVSEDLACEAQTDRLMGCC